MRGLIVALERGYSYKSPQAAVDHLVVGGGIIGLAIAQRLSQRFPEKSTYLVERHSRAGEETSSRNSEVIHAGIYYPPHSLKTRLCVRGRELMYARCDSHSIPYRKLGKLIVATFNPAQRAYLEKLHAHCSSLRPPPFSALSRAVPTRLISGHEAREMEPDLGQDIAAALYSPETGIVDSHAFMDSLETDVEGSDGGELVYGTEVVSVDPAQLEDVKREGEGWVVQTVTAGSGAASDAILARTLINASGLASNQILNRLLPMAEPPQPLIPIYYARGSYAKYRGPGVSKVKSLIYPVPEDGGRHAFHGLGTHLTLDMDGNVRFGPDVEWLEPPSSTEGHSTDQSHRDYWAKHLVPSDEHLEEMYRTITSYLPGISASGLEPDYVGIRPKLNGPGGGFNDFVIRLDRTGKFTREKRDDEGAPMVTLMGIESPGLTASLALAEMVVDEVLYGQNHG